MNKVSFSILAIGIASVVNAQNMYTAVYSAGEILSDVAMQTVPIDVTCPGTLVVNVPAGEIVDSTVVSYDFWSSMAGFGSPTQQRSYLKCPTTGVDEPSLTLCSNCQPTTESYQRTTMIANGVSSGSITFELHLGNTSLFGNSCDFNHHVVNNTWTLTVYTHDPDDCLDPTGLNAQNIMTNSADIHWTPGGMENSWDLEYDTSGFQLGTGTYTPGVTNIPFVLNSLVQGTTYDVYIIAICDTNFSNTVGPLTFTTLSICPEPTSISATNISSTYAEINWMAGGTETEWELEYGGQGFLPGNGTTISGLTSTSHTITSLMALATYDVYVTAICDSVYSSTPSGPFTFTTLSDVGIFENTMEFSMWQGTDGQLFVKADGISGFYWLQVFDALGRVAADTQVFIAQNEKMPLQVSLKKGIYLALLSTKDQMARKKLIIDR